MKLIASLGAAFRCMIVCVAITVRAAEVAPTDPNVRYIGRFDHSEAGGPRCAWTASAVGITVSGGSLSVKLKDGGKNVWQVVVNGEATRVLTLEQGEHIYPVAEKLPPGRHLVELVKRTEASVGVTQILGFRFEDGAKLLPTQPRIRRIEVIGDSISCGYGNEAASQREPFTPATENGWLAYGAIAARKLGADYVCVAWSGKRLRPDNSIPDLYDRVLPHPKEPRWDFSRWTPDVVIINLGTNDFRGEKNPDKEDFVSGYVEFIKRIRSLYPKAPIYCALGSMMSDWPPERKPRSTILTYFPEVIARASAGGGAPVRFIDFGVQNASDGYGAHFHPSVATHTRMSERLVETLKKDFGW